jgi:hypothetical protein
MYARMWAIEPSTQFQKEQKWYDKKRRDELAAVLRNLQRFLALLNVSKNSKCVQAGYLHNEPGGVIAIDQKGFSGNLQETRLYTFAIDATKTVHLITIGNKDTQHADIEYSRKFIEQFATEQHPKPDISPIPLTKRE